ncbi:MULTISPECIES: hypothetical protein [Acinetobacter]|jgi:hypothetical protein|nr:MULTISPECIES: hypothetical protein [Acinetobacter]
MFEIILTTTLSKKQSTALFAAQGAAETTRVFLMLHRYDLLI